MTPTTMAADDRVTAALNYVRRGWSLVPLRGKVPIVKEWTGLPRTTEDQARDYARAGNVGIRSGLISSLVVLDVDGEHGGFDSLAALRLDLRSVPRVLTGGGGLHFYFQYPDGGLRNSVGKLGAGLDIRGDGGQVVAPPSTHPETGEPYRWEVEPGDTLPPLPVAILDRLRQPEPGPSAIPANSMIPTGRRNQALTSLAGTMRRQGATEGTILAALRVVNGERCAPPLPDSEVAAIASSINRYAPAPDAINGAADPDHGLPGPAWPEPPDAAAWHGLAGDLVRTIEPATEADSMALLLQFLAGLGNAIGRGPHFVAEADRHALNLFVVLVGLTSKGRKGSSWAQVRRVLAPIDSEWATGRILSGLSSGEGLIWAVRDPISKTEAVKVQGHATGDTQEVLVDAGVDDKRLFVLESEFASTLRVIGRDGNTLSANVRQAWDSGDLRSLTKNSPARATGAHISIVGHITRDELRRYLDNTETANGFANRFLWGCSRRSKCLPEGGRLDPDHVAALGARIAHVVEFARKCGELRRDPGARDLWATVYPALSEGKPGIFGAVTSRAEAQTMRLACLYAILDLSSVVTPDHLRAALAVWEYCEASARFIFGDALGDPLSDEILSALRRVSDGMTRTELRDYFGRNRDANAIGRALGVLAEHGLATMSREDTGGRPTERWHAVSGTTKTTLPTNAEQ